MKVEGQCHCGAIRYEAEVEPNTIGICHCLDCQTLTGSAFRANIQARAESFRLLHGSPHRYVKTAASGAQRVHAFCENCGSPIFSCAVSDPPTYSLRVGGLNQRHELGRPARQIWTRRRLDWCCELSTVLEVDGQP
ncbi:GFA family protein [uncultured Paraburkholderia sp.]|uniref:GFA family protein n=1 Tax=uncultured Paraburkholderia sp. TaxID=1822466 RepID=UPI00338E7D78